MVRESRMKTYTYISAQDATLLLGYTNPRTLQHKVRATGPYAEKAPLPIAYTKAGKGYRYCKEDIEKHLAKCSSK